jgi:O-acetyl-ADP-ribose deacetylase (regulator of RNase III)
MFIMNQSEKRIYLIKMLLAEQPQYRDMAIPENSEEQRRLLRSLMNIRLPRAVCDEFIKIQDEYLKARLEEKGVTHLANLSQIQDGIYLWQGDITTLDCDAIVNAANSQMTGCYCPCHGCIDNAIHTFAGVQLRLECAELMRKQGFEEPTGSAKITGGYNLPCKYVLHTVGPIVRGRVSKKDETALASCYRSCLELAEKNNVKSLAFCCISTGEFCFPNRRAAEIAVETVKSYRAQTDSKIEVIFNVFKDNDYEIYREILG